MRRLITALIALALLLSSCGLPTDESARSIPLSQLPADLGPDVRPTPQPDRPEVFMIGPDGRLVPVVRNIADLPEEPEAEARRMLEELFLGTAPEEVRDGITSAVPTDTEVTAVLLGENGVLFVDLVSGGLTASSLEDRRLGFAQIVWTMTELPAISTVLFLVDDRLVEVPTDTALSPGGTAVGRLQYPSLNSQPFISFPDGDNTVPVVPTPIDALPDDLIGAPDEDIPTLDLLVWLINEDGLLVRRPRSVVERDAGALVKALLDGLETGEPEMGLRTALLPTSVVLNAGDIPVNEATGTAFLDLGTDSLPPLSGDNERLRALAQLVFTVTELREIDRVAITVEGLREPLPTQNGLAEGEVLLTRDDFALLLGEQVFGIATPTPTATRTPVAGASTDDAASTDTSSGGAAGSAPADGGNPTPTTTLIPTPSATPTPSTPTPTPTVTSTPFALQVAPTATQVP